MYKSNCCGAVVIEEDVESMTGICWDCREHCGLELTDEFLDKLEKEASYPVI